jgi:quinol monooxygenase YgiN
VKRNLRCTPGWFRDPGDVATLSAGGAAGAGRERLAMEFVVVARYQVRAGEEDRVEAALKNMRKPSRAEPGNLDYQVLRDPRQPAVFVLYERYVDEAAFQAHQDSDHFGIWLKGQVLPFLDERTRLDLAPVGD